MITGIHAIVFSPGAEKVRAFFADVLGLSSVDAGGGWPIFALPPAELAVHPGDGEGRHELYLMCDDIHATLAELRDKGVEVARDVSDQGWGLLASVGLPDGGELAIYEPRHPSPPAALADVDSWAGWASAWPVATEQEMAWSSAGLVQLNVEMLEEHGLYELLRASGIGLYLATQRMGAKNASASEARTLDETRGTALLTMERIAYDQAGRPVEFARHLYRASRYAFTTSFPRPEPVIS